MKEMEALFDKLTAEDGEYQLSLSWETKNIKNEEGKWVDIENPDKDTFEYDGYRVSWYLAGNLKHPNTPVVLVSWTSNYREDDWDENEEEVDATAEDIASFIAGVERDGGNPPEKGVPDRLEEIG